ncbi:MAG: aspartate/tyrosine/aromatic aminotransferase [Phycisphaeraceae bacterium]|nr:aspartate/tyrosine/aromatic aminotransferase [Phycisphaeraceae bacterium]
MFESIDIAPPDSILGITDAFNKDTNPRKINLSVGIYKDAQGKTPILESVKEAERRILANETNKNYKPIEGDPTYDALVQELLFGRDHELIRAKRVATAHTPGGTGGLRVAGDYLKKKHAGATVWVSDPTWANHEAIFRAAGLNVKTYPYFDAASNGLALDKMLAALRAAPAGDVVLLHGCCHNPTGVDPAPAQWAQIAGVLREAKLLPLVDFAYQGFGTGLREDAAGLLELIGKNSELLICSSFSKNFGLYNERVGALTVVAGSQSAAEAVLSHVKTCIRANYSNPPAHGSSIVATVLSDPKLRQQWEAELAAMRDRINGMRRFYVETLTKKGFRGDVSFITRQKGMFSFSGLNKEQVERLKKEHAIYIVGSGRINVAGMTEANMDPLCTAILAVS